MPSFNDNGAGYAAPATNRLCVRVSEPASEPVSVSEAKLYLRVDTNSEDTLIGELITAARIQAEHWMRRSLITQSWKLAYDDGLPLRLALPRGPVIGITSVVVVNQDNSTQTIAPSQFWLNAAKTALVSNGGIYGFRVEVTYSAGFGDASAVPKAIKQGILSHVAALYDNRGEADSGLSAQAMELYMPYRELSL